MKKTEAVPHDVKIIPVFIFSTLFFLFPFLLSSRAFAQPVTGLDEPQEEEGLRRHLWASTMGTSYDKAAAYAQKSQAESQKSRSHEIVLPNGWKMAPAGTSLDLGSMPGEAVFFAGRLVVLNNGFYPPKKDSQVSIVDPLHFTLEKNIPFHSLFPCARVGLEGDLYIAGGFDLKLYRLDKKLQSPPGHAEYPLKGYVGGLAPISKNLMAVACLMSTEGVGMWERGKIELLDTESGKVLDEADSGHFPYALEYAHGKLYATIEGENRVQVYPIKDGKFAHGPSIAAGRNPTGLCLDGDKLYVVDTVSDEITVIDTLTDKVSGTLDLKQAGFKFGAAPTSCAADQDRLYVSLAGWNAVAVLDKAEGRLLGLIPTGWYPTKLFLDRTHLYFLSAKGVKPRRPNNLDPKKVEGLGKENPAYVLNLLIGSLSSVSKADIEPNLSQWTVQVKKGSPLASPASGFKLPIRHVFYIIRENRTYDGVLGDLKDKDGKPIGNGDPKLCTFPESVTPNVHQISRDFTTLDQFFADGEISALGHSFTTSAYASPFLEWIANIGYAGRFDWKDPFDEMEPVKYLYPYGTIPAVYSPRYLWDELDAKGVDYKIYGEPYYLYTKPYRILSELADKDDQYKGLVQKYYQHTLKFANLKDRGLGFTKLFAADYRRALTLKDARDLMDDPAFAASLSRYYMDDLSLVAAWNENPQLKDAFADFLCHYSFNYAAWNLEVSDLDRVAVWKEDFKRQLESHRVPALNYLWLPNDHGGWPPPPTMRQYISQNDAALGTLLETISKSEVWKDSLVLSEEDDAQDGLDHVDATRTVALAAGPYVKHGALVDSPYDQVGMLRTIEMVLGLDPLNSSDALAVPMLELFSETPDFTPYQPPAPSGDLMREDLMLYKQLHQN